MLRQTVLARALQVAFATGVAAIAVQPAAYAQSNTTGNITGTVATPSGAVIQLQNVDTGLKRTVTPDASGRYLVTALPPGTYKVDLVRNGAVS